MGKNKKSNQRKAAKKRSERSENEATNINRSQIDIKGQSTLLNVQKDQENKPEEAVSTDRETSIKCRTEEELSSTQISKEKKLDPNPSASEFTPINSTEPKKQKNDFQDNKYNQKDFDIKRGQHGNQNRELRYSNERKKVTKSLVPYSSDEYSSSPQIEDDTSKSSLDSYHITDEDSNQETHAVEYDDSWENSDEIFKQVEQRKQKLSKQDSDQKRKLDFDVPKGIEDPTWDLPAKETTTENVGKRRPIRWSNDKGSKGNDSIDQEFDCWEGIFRRQKAPIEFVKIHEIEGDLFTQPKDHSLAHCVAEDLRMGSGIAVEFKRMFKNIDGLLNQRAKQGGLAVLQDKENRYVYYLVTKRESNGKPTYQTLWRSLCKMREHISKNNVRKLSIPRLGCGLDRLEWSRVKNMIEYVFRDVDINITVCNFQQEEGVAPQKLRTCKLVVGTYHLSRIESGTLVLYFSTVDGHADETMLALSKKFKFIDEFKNRRYKKVGDFIYTEDGNYGLGGCVVRKNSGQEMDFAGLSKCIYEINRMNRKFGKDAFCYVAFQRVDVKEYRDDLINEKIITLMINKFEKLDVYMCEGSVNDDSNKR